MPPSNKTTDLVERLAALFSGRAGAHGTHGVPVREGLKWAIKSTARTLHEPPTLALWVRHVAGEYPLGVIPIREDSTCSWGSIDVDEYDIDLVEIVVRVREAKLPLVPVRSKSGGLHLFLFIAAALAAATVQAALRDAAARLGLAGCEIFPKQRQVMSEHGDVGNWMVVPYFGGTYDGKLANQVGITPTGADMTLGEFVAAAEAARLSAEVVEKMATASAMGTPRAARRTAPGATSPVPVGASFSDGPPCLQHLASKKVETGGRSNFLLMCGIYYKRVFPEDWKRKLEEANQELLDPPESTDNLLQVIKSLNKKNYEYTCKTEPMASHCDSALCRTRRYGVGGGGFPLISGLSKLETEPPIWFVDVEGDRLEISTEDLMIYSRFQLICAGKLSKFFRGMKQADWIKVLSSIKVFPISAPDDVGVSGRFHELLNEFLTNRTRGQRREDLLSGRPWENEDESRHYFRLSDLQKFLVRENMKDLTRGQITRRIAALGGDHNKLKVSNRVVQTWWVSSACIQAPPELGPPPEKKSAI